MNAGHACVRPAYQRSFPAARVADLSMSTRQVCLSHHQSTLSRAGVRGGGVQGRLSVTSAAWLGSRRARALAPAVPPTGGSPRHPSLGTSASHNLWRQQPPPHQVHATLGPQHPVAACMRWRHRDADCRLFHIAAGPLHIHTPAAVRACARAYRTGDAVAGHALLQLCDVIRDAHFVAHPQERLPVGASSMAKLTVRLLLRPPPRQGGVAAAAAAVLHTCRRTRAPHSCVCVLLPVPISLLTLPAVPLLAPSAIWAGRTIRVSTWVLNLMHKPCSEPLSSAIASSSSSSPPPSSSSPSSSSSSGCSTDPAAAVLSCCRSSSSRCCDCCSRSSYLGHDIYGHHHHHHHGSS
jgi:hypothetical protein